MTDKLTTWEKIKTGVKGFVKAGIDYIPRGLLFSAGLFGVLKGAHAIFGIDPLSVAGVASTGQIASHLISTTVLGVVLTGAIGAYQAVKSESNTREAEIAAAVAKGRELERTRGQQRELDDGPLPTSGLPPEAMAKQKPQLGVN